MPMTKDPPVKYHPDHTYTIEQFELLNDWLKTNELVIDETPINHFELDKGRLIPIPPTPYGKELAVAEICHQLAQWNILTRQEGGVTSSQGGFNVSTTGEKTIRAPDVAFTPKVTHRSLDQLQFLTFQGEPFHPAFVVEVEDISTAPKLEKLTAKIKTEYFPAGIQLAWLIDPVNKEIYVFKKAEGRTKRVMRRKHGWRDVAGGEVLPGFTLEVRQIDKVMSQESSGDDDGDDGDDGDDDDDGDERVICHTCMGDFSDHYTLVRHIENEHTSRKRKRD